MFLVGDSASAFPRWALGPLALVGALHVTSCVVPPSCLTTVYGGPSRSRQIEQVVRVSVYADPVEEPLKRQSGTRVLMWDRFNRRSEVLIDTKGIAQVFGWEVLPERCPRISQDELAEVARAWQPILDRFDRPQTVLQTMAIPLAGNDWGADRAYLEISFGSVSEKTFELRWNGKSRLPEELDIAVIATFEMICANSRRARKYLLRDLPPQVADRLDCSAD